MTYNYGKDLVSYRPIFRFSHENNAQLEIMFGIGCSTAGVTHEVEISSLRYNQQRGLTWYKQPLIRRKWVAKKKNTVGSIMAAGKKIYGCLSALIAPALLKRRLFHFLLLIVALPLRFCRHVLFRPSKRKKKPP